jgi:hypothetical protein
MWAVIELFLGYLRRISGYVGFEVLTAACMKMAIFWVVTPYRLVEVYQRFRGTYCFYHQDDDGGSKFL